MDSVAVAVVGEWLDHFTSGQVSSSDEARFLSPLHPPQSLTEKPSRDLPQDRPTARRGLWLADRRQSVTGHGQGRVRHTAASRPYAGWLAVTMDADASLTDLDVVAQGVSRSFTPCAALATEPNRDK